MLSRLKELEKAGVSSFKIEGRMKSGYYLASVINAYRRVMDGEELVLGEKELLAVAHRDYTQAYADGKNAQTVNYTDSQSKGEYKYIADVLEYQDGRAVIEMRNRFKAGDCLEILSPTDTFQKSFTVSEIKDSQGQSVTDAKLVQENYEIDCPHPVKKGDYLRLRIQ